MFSRSGLRSLLWCLLGVLGVGPATPLLAADPACDATTWNGAYGYTLSGFVYDSQGFMYMLGAVGRLVADGNGNVSGADSFSFDGTLVKREFTGTYTLNADCTGSLTLTNASGGSVHADLVFVDDGKQINMIETDAGYIFSGVLRRQWSGTTASTNEGDGSDSGKRAAPPARRMPT